MMEEHMREEEEELFPSLRAQLSAEQNRSVTATMNRDGLILA